VQSREEDQMAQELVFAMRVDGFEEPILGRVSFDQFEEPILGLEKLGMFEDPFFCEILFKGEDVGLKVETAPMRETHFDPPWL
jgi:hypothetical protein